jgi:predicted phage terminase large subunit-like protein
MKKIENTESQKALLAATRSDLGVFSERIFLVLNPGKLFLPSWHNTVVTHALERCMRGEVTRLAILLPPRQLKSTIVSVALPAFILGYNPSARIICASYSSHLAVELSNKTRKILNEPWYQQAFPGTKIGSSDTQSFFNTSEGGYRFSTTPGGPMTGIGADLIILDDPQKASDMVYENSRNEAKIWLDDTVYSRFDNPKTGVLIIVMQRLHEDDLIGHVLQGNGWEVIKIPIKAEEDLNYQLSDNVWHRFKMGEFLQPKLFGQKEFEEYQNSMGTSNFYAQFQQSPVPPAGNLFDWKWFKPELAPPAYSEVIISLDVAASKASGNYSAFTVWGHRNGNWYLLAAYRYQYELPEVRKKLLDFDKLYRPDLIVIDGVGVGLGLVQELRNVGALHIQRARSGGKIQDADSVAPMIEGGRVFYLTEAPGLASFRDEVIAFPKGKYADQVDSMVQVLKRERAIVARAQLYKRPERQTVHSSKSTYTFKVTKIQSPY